MILRKIFIICAVGGILLSILVYRYYQLRTRVNLALFFNNASYCLSSFQPIDVNGQFSRVPESFKSITGNLTPRLRELFPQISTKYFIDPFSSKQQVLEFLDIRYGIVNHPVTIESTWYKPDESVWFTFSCGPSRIEPQYHSNKTKSSVTKFQFESVVYDISNGLWSRGYLFVDLQGVCLGEVP